MEDSGDKMIISSEKGVLTIRLNNPKKKNSMTHDMLTIMIKTLDEALQNDEIKVIYFTSTGEIFSSGNDFNNFYTQTKDEMIKYFEIFINYLINYPKVLIAGVNGPAVGVSFTMLGHFDIVLCSDTAIFTVPFIQTFQTPEGCSSYLFPLLLGKSMANHLLLNGGVMSPAEAKNLGFVANVYEAESFVSDAYDYVLKVAKHPTKNLMKNKEVIMRSFRQKLIEVNKDECKDLRSMWDNQEFQTILNKFVKKPKF
jgi:peroxisomal 3,2-trans-enoyl-CoA isomerase